MWARPARVFTNADGNGCRGAIERAINEGATIEVFARVSPYQTVFGRKVSTYALEEQALWNLFRPAWNKAMFPVPQHHDDVAKAAALFADIPGGEQVSQYLEGLEPEEDAQFLNMVTTLIRVLGESGSLAMTVDPQSPHTLLLTETSLVLHRPGAVDIGTGGDAWVARMILQFKPCWRTSSTAKPC